MSRRRGNRKTDYERESRRLFLSTIATLAASLGALSFTLYSRWDAIIESILSSKIAIHLCHAAQTLASSLGSIAKSSVSLLALFILPYLIGGFIKNFVTGIRSVFMVEKGTPTLKSGGREVEILGHSVILVPSSKPFAFSTGVIGGKIYISEALANNLSRKELETVVLHEVGHVKYRHPIKRLILWSVLSPFVFVPGRLEIFKRFRLMTELAADQYAVEMGADPIILAESIIKTAKMNSRGENPQSANFSSREVSRRVRALLGEDKTHRRENRSKLFGRQIATLASCLALAAILVVVPSLHLPHGCVKAHHSLSGEAHAARPEKNISICTEIDCKYCQECAKPAADSGSNGLSPE